MQKTGKHRKMRLKLGWKIGFCVLFATSLIAVLVMLVAINRLGILPEAYRTWHLGPALAATALAAGLMLWPSRPKYHLPRWAAACVLVALTVYTCATVSGEASGLRKLREATSPQVDGIAYTPCAMADAADWDPIEDTLAVFCRFHHISRQEYPDSLIELWQKHPETRNFVLEYPLKKDLQPQVDLGEYAGSKTVPLFMQWDQRWGYLHYGDDLAGLTACGPVCLSMAAYYLTGDPAMSPDQMIRFATENEYYVPGNGTAWTLISRGGRQLGLNVTVIPLVEDRVRANLEVGNPIICAVGPGDFTTTGHYIVMVGYENGMIRINDPNSYANSQKLWRYADIEDQIENLWVMRAG